jgi:hypothetical protein
MEKDSKRFADSGGWGYAVFDYDVASDTFKPGTTSGTPPQGNDAQVRPWLIQGRTHVSHAEKIINGRQAGCA